MGIVLIPTASLDRPAGATAAEMATVSQGILLFVDQSVPTIPLSATVSGMISMEPASSAFKVTPSARELA